MVKRSTAEEKEKTKKEILKLWKKLPRHEKEHFIRHLLPGTSYGERIKRRGIVVIASEKEVLRGFSVNWIYSEMAVVHLHTHKHRSKR
ncbi:MAG: hypothetical protein KAR00_01480 [Candidatus Pacebacteria bacterium]|nr:hypothetical protein [Candidatus Paceibacterota bacterium]